MKPKNTTENRSLRKRVRELEAANKRLVDAETKRVKEDTAIFQDAVDGHRASHLAIFGNLDNYTPLFGIRK